MDYPMVTVCAADVVSSTKVAGRSGRARTLPVRSLRSSDEALDEIEREARIGKAVLYIRNTVDDALDAHAALTARGLDPGLFHARFALADRLGIEKRIVEAFGKRSTCADRAGRVLVATQVVEQSLDLDFDTLVTDLAPIDLLIQRAGRLWRRERPERSGRPELLVVGPEPVAGADEDWFSRAFPRARYVSGPCPPVADRPDAGGHRRDRESRGAKGARRVGLRVPRPRGDEPGGQRRVVI